ncbi:head decoration protein [Comamonas sp.]|uniref:head decoration protein n=1 Tax=Comamonas sp. TaxID=34028 RepID=UPI0012BF5809|nr:head decoration protein [Comamonas sp.]MPS93729.1 head decoration protein [Comamonas sp.]
MPALAEPLNLGDLLKYEAPNLYSRDRVTVASGQNLPLGTVVGIVTATAKFKQLDPSAEDGTQVAAGVLLQACDAALIDRDDGLVVTRHAIVAHHALAWPDAITTAEKLAALAQLKALGVLVRQGA